MSWHFSRGALRLKRVSAFCTENGLCSHCATPCLNCYSLFKSFWGQKYWFLRSFTLVPITRGRSRILWKEGAGVVINDAEVAVPPTPSSTPLPTRGWKTVPQEQQQELFKSITMWESCPSSQHLYTSFSFSTTKPPPYLFPPLTLPLPQLLLSLPVLGGEAEGSDQRRCAAEEGWEGGMATAGMLGDPYFFRDWKKKKITGYCSHCTVGKRGCICTSSQSAPTHHYL